MSSTAGLQTQIDELQLAVQQLQQQLAAAIPDTLTPTYITLGPDGQVSADFTGVITAEGLTIPAYIGATVPEIPNQAQWTDPENNQVGWVAGQQDASEAGFNYLRLASITAPGGQGSVVTIGSQDDAGNTQALLSTEYGAAVNPSAYVTAHAGTEAVDIIDSNGGSTFKFDAQPWGLIYGISNTIPYDAITTIYWDAANAEVGNGMGCVGEYMEVPQAGVYLFNSVATAAAADFVNDGVMELFATVNGNAINWDTDTTAVTAGANYYPSARCCTLLILNAGDKVYADFYQTITAAANNMTMFGGKMLLARLSS